jgi:DNA (cytosine-5)-methyltransferase 1
MEESALDPAPIWDDLATFDGAAWRGSVDIISAGFPCQPFSAAGKKRGKADDRWLWPLIADTIDAVRPSRVFLENVPGLVKHGLVDVLSSLDEMGFNAEWGMFRASEVGAPHKRERFFLLAYSNGVDDNWSWRRPGGWGELADGGAELADADSGGFEVVGVGPPFDGFGPSRGYDVDGRSEEVADADSESAGRDVAAASGTEERHGRLDENKRNGFADGVGPAGRARPATFPPVPDDADGWGRWVGADGPKPTIRRGSDGSAYRVDRLRALGNSAVPQCVAAAYTELELRHPPTAAMLSGNPTEGSKWKSPPK